jgi:hypothetical protein
MISRYTFPTLFVSDFQAPVECQLYPTLSPVVPCDLETVTMLLPSTTVVSSSCCLFTNLAVDPTGRQLYPVLSPVVPSDLDIVTTLPPSMVSVLSFPLVCLLETGMGLRICLLDEVLCAIRAKAGCGDCQSSGNGIAFHQVLSNSLARNGKRLDITAKHSNGQSKRKTHD